MDRRYNTMQKVLKVTKLVREFGDNAVEGKLSPYHLKEQYKGLLKEVDILERTAQDQPDDEHPVVMPVPFDEIRGHEAIVYFFDTLKVRMSFDIEEVRDYAQLSNLWAGGNAFKVNGKRYAPPEVVPSPEVKPDGRSSVQED